MALGAGYGAVEPVTVTEGAMVLAKQARQDAVIKKVELRFIKRVEVGWGLMPVIIGRGEVVVMVGIKV